MKLAKPALLAAALLTIIALAYALLSKPDAPAATFVTLDGRPIQLGSLRGKVVLVNFWEGVSGEGWVSGMSGRARRSAGRSS